MEENMSKFKFIVSGNTKNLEDIVDLIDLDEFSTNWGMTVFSVNTFTEVGGVVEPRFEFQGFGGENANLEDIKEQLNIHIKSFIRNVHPDYEEIKIEKVEFE
jgi:hypothetical protein